MAMEFSIGGFNVKGGMVAVALPVLSTVSGGVYFGYDTLNRFYGVEAVSYTHLTLPTILLV